MRHIAICIVNIVAVLSHAAVASAQATIAPTFTTAPLPGYEEAPGTPDADDPAVWIDRREPSRSLIIGTAKDAGLLVYDLNGRLRQAIRPANAPHVSADDPPTPAGINLDVDRPCPDSTSGETFGRFNNVDIAYDVRLGPDHRSPVADVAVVSDRGCDRIRFYRIDGTANPPLADVTAVRRATGVSASLQSALRLAAVR